MQGEKQNGPGSIGSGDQTIGSNLALNGFSM